jgi:hypothetical protein
MRLRRGLVYAAIHTTISVGLIYWQEQPFWEYIPVVPSATKAISRETLGGLDVDDVEDKTPLTPCEAANISERPTSSQEKIVAIDNLPIALITGWHLPCSPPSRLDERIQARYGFTQKAERVTGWLLCSMALVLWFIVGGYPMIRRRFRRWYTEPGLFMTVCTLASLLVLGIGWSISRIPPHMDAHMGEYVADAAEVVIQLAALPMVFAAAGWAWWVGLIFWTRWKAARRWFDRRTLVED